MTTRNTHQTGWLIIHLPSWNMKAPSKYSEFESVLLLGRLNSIMIWGPALTKESGVDRDPFMPRTVRVVGEHSL